MKKRLCLLTVLLVILIAITVTAAATTNITVTLDGKEIQFSDDSGYPFADDNNRVQIPLRVVAEAFNCDVSWDAQNNCAVISKDGITVTVPVGKKHIVVDGKIVDIDTASITRNNRTYMPIRAVLESLGANVEWDSKRQTVVITSPSPVMQFKDIYVNSYGDLIVLLLDGTEKNLGRVRGTDGYSGRNGVSVSDAYIDTSGDLIIVLSNKEVINAGSVTSGSTSKSFEDYDVGTKFYMTAPSGKFSVPFYVGAESFVAEFDAIYYELTAKYTADDPKAWYFRKETHSTYFLPYQVTVYINGKTDTSLAGYSLTVYITDTQAGYYCFARIEDDGTFHGQFVIGNGVDSINVWHAPRKIYFNRLAPPGYF